MTATDLKPIAYSYVRFSTVEQEEGDSERRQIDRARKWAQDNGHTLDEDFIIDRGKSAWVGAHLTAKGALGGFIKKVKNGGVPEGSTLIIENFDRFSRERISVAQDHLREIVNAGIKVVTLSDGQIYDKYSFDDLAKLIIMSLNMSRSTEESNRKAELLQETWAQKRKDAAKGKLFTKQVPYWLKYNEKTRDVEPIEERVKVVQDIFHWYTDDSYRLGCHKIMSRLNTKGVEPFKRYKDRDPNLWSVSSVKAIIKHLGVIGLFQPMRVTKEQVFSEDGDFVRVRRIRTPVGEPVSIYPKVITEEQFYMAQMIMKGKGGKGGRTGAVNNLFVHHTNCGYCNSTIHHRNSGGKKNPHWQYIRCSSALRNGDCDAESVCYLPLEAGFLKYITELDVERIVKDEKLGEKHRKVGKELNRLQVKRFKLQKQRDLAKKYMLDPDFADDKTNFEEDFKRLGIELKPLPDEIATLEHELRALESPKHDTQEHLDLVKKLTTDMSSLPEKERQQLRERLRGTIAQLVDKMIIYADGTKDQEIVWDVTDLLVRDFVPPSTDLVLWAETEGTPEDVEKYRQAVEQELAEHHAKNTGKKAAKVLIIMKGGYQHLLGYNPETKAFEQEMAITKDAALMIGEEVIIS